MMRAWIGSIGSKQLDLWHEQHVMRMRRRSNHAPADTHGSCSWSNNERQLCSPRGGSRKATIGNMCSRKKAM